VKKNVAPWSGADSAHTRQILAEYERRDRDGKSALVRREGLFTSSIFGVAQAA
jgi:hypothetical protein